MAKDYGTREDMRMRLNRTIVRYDGDYYICDVDALVDQWYQVNLLPFPNSNSHSTVADHRDHRFATNGLELGYFQNGTLAIFATRAPERKQKAGLSADCVYLVDSKNVGGNWFHSNGFYKMLCNDYLKPEAALARMAKDYKGVPISRDFAFKHVDGFKIGLFFRERLVGYQDPLSKTILMLNDKATSFISRSARNIGVAV